MNLLMRSRDTPSQSAREGSMINGHKGTKHSFIKHTHIIKSEREKEWADESWAGAVQASGKQLALRQSLPSSSFDYTFTSSRHLYDKEIFNQARSLPRE